MKIFIKKLILLSLILVACYIPNILPVNLASPIYGSTLLEDNFNDNNANDGTPIDWDEYLGSQGSWIVSNGEYIGSVVKNLSEDLPTYSIAGNPNWTNFRFTVRVKGLVGIDKILLFRFTSLDKTYGIKITSSWPDYYGDKIILLKNNMIDWVQAPPFVNSINTWYTISILVLDNNIKVFVDNSIIPIIDYTDLENPNLSGKIGLMAWPGFYNGYGSITTTAFDDVLVTTIDETPTNTPTPTPTPTEITPTPTEIPSPTPSPLPKIVFLPGLGSSWNNDTMINGKDVDQSKWHAIPGLKLYDNLLNTLKSAGYKSEGNDQNLFTFYYNWTKPVDKISQDLKSYIDNVVKPSADTKIDLIGHSLGGLVARTYVQNNSGNQVDKLITLASPHKGSPTSYYVWEGGQLEKALEFWQRIGAGLYLRLKSPLSATDMETIHSNFPVIKDLLPTFDYLNKNSVPVSLSTMLWKNNWLIGLNNGVSSSLTQHLSSFIGDIPDSTIEWINVGDRSWTDKLVNLWPDGKPIGSTNSNGDKYVLLKSANLYDPAITKMDGKDHGTIVTDSDSIQKIVDTLSLTPSVIYNIPDFSYEPSLVFYLASPAIISSLTDENNNPVGFIDEKLATIPDAKSGKYKIQITGTGKGNYDLYLGRILKSGDIWEMTSGQINKNEVGNYELYFDPQIPNSLIIDPTGTILRNSLRTKLDDLKKYCNNQNLNRGLCLFLTAQFNIVDKQIGLGKFDEGIETLYNLRIELSNQGFGNKLASDRTIYLKNTIQGIIEDLQNLYLLKPDKKDCDRNKISKAQIVATNLIFDKAEKELKNLTNKNRSDPFMGTVYLLAKNKFEKGKNTTSCESSINLLGARHLSEELLLLTK